MAGIKLTARESVLAGEAMAAAAVRADEALPVPGPFLTWASTGSELGQQVVTLARYVTATNVLSTAARASAPVEIDIDRDDLATALDLFAVEREDDGGKSYRDLAERIRGGAS